MALDSTGSYSLEDDDTITATFFYQGFTAQNLDYFYSSQRDRLSQGDLSVFIKGQEAQPTLTYWTGERWTEITV